MTSPQPPSMSQKENINWLIHIHSRQQQQQQPGSDLRKAKHIQKKCYRKLRGLHFKIKARKTWRQPTEDRSTRSWQTLQTTTPSKTNLTDKQQFLLSGPLASDCITLTEKSANLTPSWRMHPALEQVNICLVSQGFCRELLLGQLQD